ncbi:MAG TPA: 3-methyl-2-oxobutanoate dehydrogenase subunit beta, partial [Smithella sp.]|nr:3-methyl-2-oxobutanoate dehydrogenase subunit beta [Smithella sp.]
MNKVLMSGNFVIGEAAIRAGCRFYAGYPITPQNELTEYMAEHIRNAEGGVFIQSESEIAAINMIAGASAAGLRVMTSSSSPGISLKQEGISSMAACELPGIIVNIMRGGPGLGNIRPSQGDYFQATRGGGHGDYRTIVLAPASGQELADLTMDAFDLADKYRTPAMILADGMMGQMMEPVIFKKPKP